jgi:hypothetical protein
MLREQARALGVASVGREARGILIRMGGDLSARERTWLPVEFRGRLRAVPEGLLLTDSAGGEWVRVLRDILDAIARLRREAATTSRPVPVGGPRA